MTSKSKGSYYERKSKGKRISLTKKGEDVISKKIQEDPKGYLIENIEDIFECYEQDKDKTTLVLDLFAVQEILAQHGYRAIDLLSEEIFKKLRGD